MIAPSRGHELKLMSAGALFQEQVIAPSRGHELKHEGVEARRFQLRIAPSRGHELKQGGDQRQDQRGAGLPPRGGMS